MKCNWKWVLSSFVALPISYGSAYAGDSDDPPTKTSTVVIVKSDDKGDDSDIQAKVLKELERAGVSKDQQEKIMAHLKESLAHAEKAKASGVAAGKAAADAGKAAATAIVKRIQKHADAKKDEGGEKSEQVIILKGKDGEPLTGTIDIHALADKLPEGIRGRVLHLSNTDSSYRIGISLDSTEDSEDDGDEKQTADGLKVAAVLEDSPAVKAGIKKGDIVVSVNGKVIKEVGQLQTEVQTAGKDDKPLTLTVKRDGNDIEVKVKPAKTEGGDFGVMNLNLAPENGFIFGNQEWQGIAKAMPKLQQFSFSDESLKKEIKELKDEVAELKSMIKSLIEKK